jgi:hypothetical protein
MPSTAVGRAAYRLPLIILISIATLGVTPTLRAQGSMSPFNGASSGGDYKDPAQKAADAYSRGMKAKRQAEEEKDPKAQRKLLERAKNEIGKSVGYSASYDSLLALGQVELALGEKAAALQSCTHALSWKPAAPDALTCQSEAGRTTVTGIQAAPPPAPAAVGTEPAAESAPPR